MQSAQRFSRCCKARCLHWRSNRQKKGSGLRSELNMQAHWQISDLLRRISSCYQRYDAGSQACSFRIKFRITHGQDKDTDKSAGQIFEYRRHVCMVKSQKIRILGVSNKHGSKTWTMLSMMHHRCIASKWYLIIACIRCQAWTASCKAKSSAANDHHLTTNQQIG